MYPSPANSAAQATVLHVESEVHVPHVSLKATPTAKDTSGSLVIWVRKSSCFCRTPTPSCSTCCSPDPALAFGNRTSDYTTHAFASGGGIPNSPDGPASPSVVACTSDPPSPHPTSASDARNPAVAVQIAPTVKRLSLFRQCVVDGIGRWLWLDKADARGNPPLLRSSSGIRCEWFYDQTERPGCGCGTCTPAERKVGGGALPPCG